MSGEDLIIEPDKNTPEKSCYAYKNKNEKRKIGHRPLDSETKYPNKFICEDSILWDCPGFLDSGGQDEQIINTYHINSISNQSKFLRFILVIDARPINENGYGPERGKGLKELYEILYIMTKNQNIDLSKHLLIVFFNATQNMEFYKNKMFQFYGDMLYSKSFNQII